ncbi:MAG: ABC transporter permease subunit [Actinobacteria bacterium]|nr:MAG: ABC transporter permease subunit [Actinomycetota bacterium]
MFVLALLLVCACWELYKTVGPDAGGKILGARLLPKAENRAMPHVWDMARRFGRPELRGSSRTVGQAVAAGAWYTFRLAFVGLLLGVIVGMGLAILMARFRVVERGLLPWLIISQTVPLIALAPLVVSWGGRLHIGGFTWQKWMSASVIAAFLAFFPVAVGALRGLTSPPPAALELLASYAAPWSATLFKLRLPAAVPYLMPALRLAANAAVIGTIVAEISTGLKGGIGRLILEYMREATADPAKVFTAVMGAAVLGLVMAGLVGLLDGFVSRHRPRELTT